MGRKKNHSGWVYSTDPGFDRGEDEEVEQVEPGDQQLIVRTDKKNRKGKIVTLILGFEGPGEDRKELAKGLKKLCGTGGSDNEEEILIQGDFKQKIHDYLIDRGYSQTKLR